MFIVDLSPTYKTKIVVKIPSETTGEFDSSEFMAAFKRVAMEVTEEDREAGQLSLDQLRALPQKKVLEYVLVGWTGLVTKSKDEVPYSEENRAALLRIPQAFNSLADGFWNSIFKKEDLKAKN